jgi:hypothetical protein
MLQGQAVTADKIRHPKSKESLLTKVSDKGTEYEEKLS